MRLSLENSRAHKAAYVEDSSPPLVRESSSQSNFNEDSEQLLGMNSFKCFTRLHTDRDSLALISSAYVPTFKPTVTFSQYSSSQPVHYVFGVTRSSSRHKDEATTVMREEYAELLCNTYTARTAK